MIPYGSFLYFLILALVCVPVVLLSALRVRTAALVLASSLLMLVVQYWLPEAHGLGGGRIIVRVLAFVVFQWLLAVVLLALRPGGPRWSRSRVAAYWLVLLLSLLPLVLVKAHAAENWVAFLGISYATFRAMDVLFGIRDGLITSANPATFVAYLIFFPSISSGPIDRYRRFAGDFHGRRTGAEIARDADAAMQHLFLGLFQKFVLAALVQYYWMAPAAYQHGWGGTWSYMYAYSAYLYFDFAGYSAMAIGVGYLLGIRMPENFERPYLALNIADFWNRWHITLSTWIRDHIYRRFAMAAARGKWFRQRTTGSYVGLGLAFTLMGFWHGLEWNYIVYGAYHGVLLVGYAVMTRPGRPRRPLPRPLQWLITFHVVCFGFLIFSGRLF